MNLRTPKKVTQTTALAENPLDGERVLLDAMFGPRRVSSPELAPTRGVPPAKPQHYKIVSISLYHEDLDRLDQMVQELKRRGHPRASKSQLIREALFQLDLDRIAKAR